MQSTRISKYFALALAIGGACVAYSQSAVRDIANALDAYADKSREQRELEAAPEHIKEIFALAKKSAEEDGNINFCGFFIGMSPHDAADLCEYYLNKSGRGSLGVGCVYESGKAVWALRFSLKAVRSITKGGNTFEELAQSVANRVGTLKKDYGKGEYGLKTIDGVVVRMKENGLYIYNEDVKRQKPIRATAEAAQKDKADIDAREKAVKEAPSRLIGDMVAIPGKNFKMGKYEVTQMQWYAVMGDNPSEFKGDDNPVEKVSWDDCKKFLEKLNSRPEVKASGLTFRLPTEKEWEYACRAGATGDFCKLPDGSEITESTLGEVAWYDGNSGGKTHPVGQKKPNAFGLYDMHGNVWEWCEDLYLAGGSHRVYRGGGWNYYSRDCAAGYRDHYNPDARNYYLGFRLAASQDMNR